MEQETGRVLVVDDDARNRRLLKDLLEAHGYETALAVDGTEALRLVEAQVPDAVLLDVLMPGPDGFEICRQLKAAKATAHVPVLLVTALTARKDHLKGIESGANDFITKPIDPMEVVLRVRNAIRAKRLFDELQQRYRELQQLQEMRDSLTQMIAHDNRALDAVIRWIRVLQGGAAAGREMPTPPPPAATEGA